MALIKCPECNKEISDKSEVCIHCGFPVKGYLEEKNTTYDLCFQTGADLDSTDKQNKIYLIEEIMGYSRKEAEYITNNKVCKVVQNITKEQFAKIVMIFKNYDIGLYGKLHSTEKVVFWNELPNYPFEPVPLQDYYCDEPMISAENRVDIYKKPEVPQRVYTRPVIDNTPKCPKCGSTHITAGARGVNFTWGLVGASQTVNRCSNCGHTWKPSK